MPALRLERTCPKCGSHLMLREGEHGDFLACPRFPSCRYTESFKDESELVWRGKKGGCKACKFTGLLPFTRKDGSIAHDVFYDCPCKEEGFIERYQPITPSDFDFPISYDFHRSLCKEYGWPDAGDLEGLHKEDVPGVNDAKERFYLTEYASKEDLDKLKALIVNLRNQFNSHTDKKRTNKYTIN